MSIGHRITGAGLATLIYGVGIAYAIMQPGSVTETVVDLIATWVPNSVLVASKFVLAMPFFFHVYNGIRHLVWDIGKGFSIRAVYAGGWLVNIGALVSAAIVAVI